ncbi:MULTISPECIES: septation ring formation regulator EzrA [unclassified Bacillus (in: firmicutes)]|uniref:septation ring formation regulator EzrA n=1 Tax=unclassified Bacillus (in: firmicutes) TaxID=185979 RepID=UPI000BEF38BF|nr:MULTISPECIES: septation ring formation regulator EzrA [unclassified Bacillus (in: firmicutes)]PEJ57898.1 septation ring formation regulator EzrA [Bacillus sp. AFS002410]PEL12532.1 septation ring formation regulator EzrA [Bacillus sp. AFS017336]
MTFYVILVVISIVIALMIVALTIRQRLYKRLDELEAWKMQLMSKPVTDELSKLKALNMTGQTEELFEKWRTDWDEIVTAFIPKVTDSLQEIDEAINKYHFMKAKAGITELEARLNEAETSVELILNEVSDLVGSEEQNNSDIEKLNQEYLEQRKLLLTHRHLYSISETQLEEKMDEIKQQVQLFNETTENGNYLEARELVKHISDEVNTLKVNMQIIPDLYIESTTTMPSQIHNLSDGLKQMKADGYALDFELLENETIECSKICIDCVELIKKLEITEANDKLELVKAKVDAIYDLLEKEVESKYVVEKEIWTSQEEILEIRENNLKTKEETQLVQQIYELSDEDTKAQKLVEKQVSIITKRFELLQIRVAEQDLAFSVIRNELDLLKNQMEEVKESHLAYVEMLKALRKDELQARDQLIDMKRLMLEVKRLVQISNLPGMPVSSMKQIQDAHDSMQRVYLELEKKPLKMTTVSSLLEQAATAVNDCYKETKYMIEQGYFVEKVIQYGNRYRSNNVQMATSMDKAEQLFREFQYNEALEEAAVSIENVEPGAIDKLQEILNEQKYTLPL